jgi:hypothetical protein
MLLSLAVMEGHVLAMAVITLWLVGERLDAPRAPSWRLRAPGRAVRALTGHFTPYPPAAAGLRAPRPAWPAF